MKKALTLLFLFAALISHAQYATEAELRKEKNLTAGDCLIKSANYQYTAIICGFAAVGINMIGAYQVKQDYPDDAEKRKELMKQYNAMTIGIGVIGSIFAITSIQYKKKAGTLLNQQPKLQAYISPTGAGLKFKF